MTAHTHHQGESAVVSLPRMDIHLEAHEHEGAIALSCALQPNAGCVIVFSAVVEMLVSLASALEEAGAFIGHVKAFAEDGSCAASASVTDLTQGAAVVGDPDMMIGPNALVQAVAIIVGLSTEEALAIFKETLTLC